ILIREFRRRYSGLRAGTGNALFIIGNIAAFSIYTSGYLLLFRRPQLLIPSWLTAWIQAAGLFLMMWFAAALVAAAMWRLTRRRASPFDARRREFLGAATAGLVAAPIALATIGVIERERFRVSEVDIPIAGLPKDLDGLRIAQISDIHLSPFLSPKDFARAVDMANETKAHLMLVTGDLITRTGDPLDACLKQLARLRAGVILGCLGNHEIYTRTEDYVTQQGARIGIDFLRMRTRPLKFGDATINFAGVDYQPLHKPYLVGAEKLVVPGMLNILLSHNPDVFPVAAGQGYDLTIGGHTHGGQINVEILHSNLNVARYFTPYTRGLYRKEDKAIYVSSGLGTVGMPVRLGAPPEISLLRLCAS
ncbi:MAG: metallophosphoesterase, partial [Bryobacteraceae bacterium]